MYKKKNRKQEKGKIMVTTCQGKNGISKDKKRVSRTISSNLSFTILS